MKKVQRNILIVLFFVMLVVSILSALNTNRIVHSLIKRFPVILEAKDALSDLLGVKIYLYQLQNMLHVPVFASLAFCWALFFANRGWRLPVIVIAAVGLVSVFGLLDEAHQFFVKGRDASWEDWGLDILGGFLGVGLWMLYARITGRPVPAGTGKN